MFRWLSLTALLAFSVFMVMVVVLSNQGRDIALFHLFIGLPHFDKVGHFILMGLASFLAVLAIAPRLRTTRWKASLRVMAVVLLLATAEEFCQIAFPSRTFSLMDLLASAAGIGLLGCLASTLLRFHKSTSACSDSR